MGARPRTQRRGAYLGQLPRRASERAVAQFRGGGLGGLGFGFVQSMDFATVIAPMCGAVIANAMFISGLPAVLARRREGRLLDFNPLPMPLIFGNCLGWLTYSFLKRDPFVAAANVPGLILGACYVMATVRLAEPDLARRVEALMLAVLSVHAAAGVTCAFFLESRDDMERCYGYLCNAILLAYYGAPLSTLAEVVKRRSAASIYLPTVLLNGLNACFWSSYALAIDDPFMLAPNIIGAGLTLGQLLLVCLFGEGNFYTRRLWEIMLWRTAAKPVSTPPLPFPAV